MARTGFSNEITQQAIPYDAEIEKEISEYKVKCEKEIKAVLPDFEVSSSKIMSFIAPIERSHRQMLIEKKAKVGQNSKAVMEARTAAEKNKNDFVNAVKQYAEQKNAMEHSCKEKLPPNSSLLQPVMTLIQVAYLSGMQRLLASYSLIENIPELKDNFDKALAKYNSAKNILRKVCKAVNSFEDIIKDFPIEVLDNEGILDPYHESYLRVEFARENLTDEPLESLQLEKLKYERKRLVFVPCSLYLKQINAFIKNKKITVDAAMLASFKNLLLHYENYLDNGSLVAFNKEKINLFQLVKAQYQKKSRYGYLSTLLSGEAQLMLPLRAHKARFSRVPNIGNFIFKSEIEEESQPLSDISQEQESIKDSDTNLQQGSMAPLHTVKASYPAELKRIEVVDSSLKKPREPLSDIGNSPKTDLQQHSAFKHSESKRKENIMPEVAGQICKRAIT